MIAPEEVGVSLHSRAVFRACVTPNYPPTKVAGVRLLVQFTCLWLDHRLHRSHQYTCILPSYSYCPDK
jgi:hypothetical protein